MTDTRRTSGDAAALPADVLEKVEKALDDLHPELSFCPSVSDIAWDDAIKAAKKAVAAIRASLRPVGQDRDAARIDAWAANPDWRLNLWNGQWRMSKPERVLTDWVPSARAAIDAAMAAPADGEKT